MGSNVAPRPDKKRRRTKGPTRPLKANRRIVAEARLDWFSSADRDRVVAHFEELVSLREECGRLIEERSDFADIERWFFERFVPAMNASYSTGVRFCVECGRKFAPHDRRDEFCSPSCSGSRRMRGWRAPEQRRRDAAAARANEAADDLREHVKTCPTCGGTSGRRPRKLCPRGEALLAVATSGDGVGEDAYVREPIRLGGDAARLREPDDDEIA
jgi:hypothetical protein